MGKEPLFRPVNEPGLWVCELCQDVEIGAKLIRCCVVPTKESASGLGFDTVYQKLKDRLRKDMATRAEAENVKVKVKWLDAPEDWASMPPRWRTRYVLHSIGYVPAPFDLDGTRTVFADSVSEHWRRTLDRL